MKTIPLRFINTNPKALNTFENFSIRDVDELMSGKDLIQEIHRHDFFFILALRNGKGEHTIDFVPYKITNNSVFFMRPGQVHKLILKAGSSGYIIQFKKDFYLSNDKESLQLLRKAGSTNYIQMSKELFDKLFSILKFIFNESVDKNDRFEDVIKLNLRILLIELVRHQQRTENDNNRKNTPNIDRLEEFSELLDLHIAVNKKASQYAEMLNLTLYQLNTLTHNALGKTSSELINEHIILESKRYLLTTSNQVKEIAYHLGYDDVSYFIRFFKKHTGYSPEAFRYNYS